MRYTTKPGLKYFWLIRHARSSHTASSDFERGLSASGRADGELMADFLRTTLQDSEHVPGWLITSAAKRAQQTSDYVASAFNVSSEQVNVERSLYLAEPEALLAALQETPADTGCVALVAHNPGLTWLVNDLSEDNQQLENFPTLGCALFASNVDRWSDIHQANRVSLFTPKGVGRKV